MGRPQSGHRTTRFYHRPAFTMTDLRPCSHPEAQLRTADEDDAEILFELFKASRADLIAAIPNLDAAQKESFLRHQFRAQREQYLAQFTTAQWDLIVCQEQVVGQVLVAPLGDEIRLVDVSLLPEFRNRGIGGALLRDLLERAAHENRCVSLHVLPDNPAIHLYRRLGFVHAGEQGVHQRMEWRPGARDAVSATRTALG